MSTSPLTPGTPIWVDLGTTDLMAAVTFYRELFGWQIEDGGEEFGHYQSASIDGRRVTGIGPVMMPGQPTAWTVHLGVDDIDAAAARTVELGGSVLAPPMAVGPLGSMAVVADSSGGVVGFWQPGSHTGFEVVNAPGATCWYELNTPQTDVAADFYTKLFGYAARAVPVPGLDYRTLHLAAAGDDPVAGIGLLAPGDPRPAHWTVYFLVASLEESLDRVRDLAGAVLVDPFETPQGRIAVVADPQGAVFQLVEPPAGTPQG